MTWESVALACLALVAVGLGVALFRTRAQAVRQQSDSAAELAELRTAIDDVRRELAPPPEPEPEAPDVQPSDEGDVEHHTITDLGTEQSADLVPARIEGRLFADIVVREVAVKAASLAHGLRHGLSGETRNRIRYQMRLEVKRSRKHRKVELREARRLLAQLQRERMQEEHQKKTGDAA